MTALVSKDQRKLLFAVKRLFGVKSLLFPQSLNDIPREHYFARELRLTENRTVFLTDSGYEHFQAVVDVLDRVDYFSSQVTYSDIWNAWRKIVERWISIGLVPESANEIVEAITDIICQEIDDFTFIVPLFGSDLTSAESFALGSLTALRLSIDVLDSNGVAHDHADVLHLLESNRTNLWLKGNTRGTAAVAKARFAELTTYTVGMLAIAAASIYEWGATTFRIGAVMTPEDATGRSVWFSWHEKDRSLTTHYASPRGQPLPLDEVLDTESDWGRIVSRGLAIVQSRNGTELEQAITRAVYWYSDAHRDGVLAMRLVKYWSCVEAFFSFESEDITHAVSAGLASLLVYGGFHCVPLPEYSSIKAQIVKLYGLRSRAVHRGSHQHVTERDVGQFSQWVAWMILEMIALTERGYTTLDEVKAQTDRLDEIQQRKYKE